MDCLELADDQPFDLDCTLNCGQLFRWDARDGWWCGVVESSVLAVRQRGHVLDFDGVDVESLISYFQLDLDLNRILSSIDRDPAIHAAIGEHRGLRLVRQDPWECLISFICAQNANIPFIRRMIEHMASRYGEPISSPYGEFRSFPKPRVLASLELDDLRSCTLGYRAGYVLETAREVNRDPDWHDRIRELEFEDARKELMRFRGVGHKVADCILLFAFQKFESFPVDVWMRKVMREHYLRDACDVHPLGCREYEYIRRFAQDHFGMYAGYAQEYLFAHYRGIWKSG